MCIYILYYQCYDYFGMYKGCVELTLNPKLGSTEFFTVGLGTITQPNSR